MVRPVWEWKGHHMKRRAFLATLAALPGLGFLKPKDEYPGSVTTFVIGSTTPSVEDHDKLWLKTDGHGNPVRWFCYDPKEGRWG